MQQNAAFLASGTLCNLRSPSKHKCLSGDRKALRMCLQYCVRAIDVTNCKPLAGLIVLTVGGLCFGLLTPLFFIATSSLPTTDHWRILSEG